MLTSPPKSWQSLCLQPSTMPATTCISSNSKYQSASLGQQVPACFIGPVEPVQSRAETAWHMHTAYSIQAGGS